jgi:transcriptional accessory protein Tex/SPT6
MVFLDDGGRMREHTKLDNLFDSETQDEFLDLLRRRKPNAIIVGGFSMATTKLAVRLREIVRGKKLTEDGWVDNDAVTYEPLDIPVIYLQDDVARVYQHSPRAVQEFGTLPLLARYCVGLARYTQSPLNELVALGPDIVSLTFDEDVQQLVSSWLRLVPSMVVKRVFRFHQTSCSLLVKGLWLTLPPKWVSISTGRSAMSTIGICCHSYADLGPAKLRL